MQRYQRISGSVSAPRPGLRREFLPTGTVDDPGVVQNAASGLSLCHRDDHAAETRADDGRTGQGFAILMLTGWPRTTLWDLWRWLVFHVMDTVWERMFGIVKEGLVASRASGLALHG